MSGVKTNNSLNTLSDVSQANEDSCVEKFNEVVAAHNHNAQICHELEDFIKKSPDLKIKNPIKGECDKIKSYYLSAQKRTSETFKQLNSEYNSLLMQETKLQFEIDELKKNSKKIKVELNEYQEKYKVTKVNFKNYKYALNLAKDTYDAKFGMDVNIDKDSDNTFVAIVYFSPKNKDLPVKFTIDRVQNKIIDFDAGSALSEDENKELKIQFKESDNVLALTCALRNKILSKV